MDNYQQEAGNKIIDKAKEVSDQIDSLVAKKLELESVQSDLYKELAAIEQKEAYESNVCEGGVHSNKRQKMSWPKWT